MYSSKLTKKVVVNRAFPVIVHISRCKRDIITSEDMTGRCSKS